MQRYIRELLHPKQARKVSALSGKRPVATKSSASRFICVPDGPKVGFLFLTECAPLPLNVLIRDDGLHSYAKREITGNLKKSICLAMSMREICENSSVPRHFLTIERGLHYLTPLGPISVHATSLRQAEQLTLVGSVTTMITHFVSRA